MMAVVPVLPFSDKCHCKNFTPWLGWRESPIADLDSPGDDAIMPTRSESRVTVSGKTSKAVELLRKRLSQLLRFIFVPAACISVAATAVKFKALSRQSIRGKRATWSFPWAVLGVRSATICPK
jgi:hypothetical protein